MPKYGIHHIILKEAMYKLRASSNGMAQSAANYLEAETNSAIIGSIGPDLFFWGPDYEVVDELYKIYKNIATVVDKYNDVVKEIRKIKDIVGEPVEDLVKTLAPGALELIELAANEIEKTSTLFTSAIGTGFFAGVSLLSGTNILTNAAGINPLTHQFFQLFVPGLQYNKNEREWYWFDMLHYRRTGQFARNLVNSANSCREKAFAFGYLSHIATDVTGHPFVNEIAGTTYRLNVHRHVTAENYQDSWKYSQYYKSESINKTLFKRLNLPQNLPSDVGDLLFNAFKDTYTGADHPTRLPGDGFYTRDQIDVTYRVFHDILKLMESMAVDRPEEPFSGVVDILNDILDNFSPPPPVPSNTPPPCDFLDIIAFGTTEKSKECYEEFFEQVDTWFNWLGELIEWGVNTLLNLINLLLTLLLELPIYALLAILYGIQLMLYLIYRSARMILSTSGFIMPEPDELDNSVARNLITLYQPCADNFNNFPSVATPVTNNLVCPVSVAEQPSTAAAFHKPGIKSTPDLFISTATFNENALLAYARSSSPEQTRNIESSEVSIGNATDFTAWMIQHANNPNITEEMRSVLYTDWNLDSDRGYGYLSWEGHIPHAGSFAVDQEGYLG
ncbi:MAG TPA: zinc dependent phospholipase C family protein [Anaerolineae bacterium]|nr:zinc dependent phospholipase C family protein [Anaerolineae bacterium]